MCRSVCVWVCNQRQSFNIVIYDSSMHVIIYDINVLEIMQWICRIIWCAECVHCKAKIVVALGGRLGAGAADVGLLVFQERDDESIGVYFILLYGVIQIDRSNGEQIIFSVYIIYSNSYILYSICDMAVFNDFNCRVIVLVYGDKSVRDRKVDFMEDGSYPFFRFVSRQNVLASDSVYCNGDSGGVFADQQAATPKSHRMSRVITCLSLMSESSLLSVQATITMDGC